MLKASKSSVMITVFVIFALCSRLAYLICVCCKRKNQPQHHVFPLFCYSYRCKQQKILKAMPLVFLVHYSLFISCEPATSSTRSFRVCCSKLCVAVEINIKKKINPQICNFNASFTF